ncbi:MAG: hypothetical protein JW787_03880 [Sedimentisphaerales bacterium]|nr:hypothetical protein [Sedimentisphaerales bacterium]
MKSFRKIEKAVRHVRVMANRAIDERILTDAEVALIKSSHNQRQAKRSVKNLWRFIMESRVTKYSAAAVAVLAFVLVLFNPFGGSKNGGVVWAEVIEKVSQMSTVIYNEQYLFWEIDDNKTLVDTEPDKLDVISYVSEEYGVVMYAYNDKGLIAQVYFLKKTNQFVIIGNNIKKYLKAPMIGDIFESISKIATPRGMVEYFTSGNYENLGRAKFGNFDVEGFETDDLNVLFPIPEPVRSLFPVTDIVGRIWIDLETSLPAGTELEFDTDSGLFTGYKKLHCEYKAHDFQWNAELPEGIFEPNIPEDCTELKITDFISAEVKAGIVGLGLLPAGLVIWKKSRKKKIIQNVKS